jgi:hypothetical protein
VDIVVTLDKLGETISSLLKRKGKH